VTFPKECVALFIPVRSFWLVWVGILRSEAVYMASKYGKNWHVVPHNPMCNYNSIWHIGLLSV